MPGYYCASAIMEQLIRSLDNCLLLDASQFFQGVFLTSFYYRVTESKNKDFAVGDYVVNSAGWVDRAIVTSEGTTKLPDVIPADKHSLGLGVLGMPGYVCHHIF